LDISILGLGFVKSVFRAGIHRVVESLAGELLKYNSIRLQFSAAMLPGLVDNYLSANPSMAKVPFSTPGGTLAVSRALDRLFGLASRENWDAGPLARTKWLAYLAGGAAVGKCLPSIRPSILGKSDVFHFPFPFASVPRQVRKAPGVQVFITAYDLIPILYPKYVGGIVRLRLQRALKDLRPSDWVLCISHSTRNDLLNYRKDLNPDRAIVTYLAASPQFRNVADPAELARVRSRYAIPPGSYLLSLCNLAPHKNLSNVIRGFAIMAKQEKAQDLSLVLAGIRGWQYDEIFKAIGEAKGLEDRIIVTGYVEENDLAALFSGATAFVYMSRYEGFGLPCLEAMSCGIPVIASNASSIPEVVSDAGILLEPNDTDSLAQAMLDVWRDGELRGALSQKALAQASRFSWERCASETVAAYRAAISASGQ
jgi:glycosyltransferase involved in cell wall biosynthesis